MRVGNFSVLIPEGRECDSGHVQVPHGTQYTLRLGNHSHLRCDADVVIDGKPMGGYRLNAGEVMTLERSYLDSGRFTFFRADSAEGQSVGAARIQQCDKGLIQVTFRPEKRRKNVCQSMGMMDNIRPRGFESKEKTSGGMLRGQLLNSCSAGSPGVTGLTGHSNQSFVSVANLDHDPLNAVIISIRLIAADVPHMINPREMRGELRSNPVPSPAG